MTRSALVMRPTVISSFFYCFNASFTVVTPAASVIIRALRKKLPLLIEILLTDAVFRCNIPPEMLIYKAVTVCANGIAHPATRLLWQGEWVSPDAQRCTPANTQDMHLVLERDKNLNIDCCCAPQPAWCSFCPQKWVWSYTDKSPCLYVDPFLFSLSAEGDRPGEVAHWREPEGLLFRVPEQAEPRQRRLPGRCREGCRRWAFLQLSQQSRGRSHGLPERLAVWQLLLLHQPRLQRRVARWFLSTNNKKHLAELDTRGWSLEPKTPNQDL